MEKKIDRVHVFVRNQVTVPYKMHNLPSRHLASLSLSPPLSLSLSLSLRSPSHISRLSVSRYNMAMASLAPALLVLLLAIPAKVHGASHTVGDSSGWTQNYDYTTWAASQTFNVGDTLVFSYGSSHSVDQVSKDDYDNCNGGSALKSYNSGSDTITLSSTGPMYFICPAIGHCSGGMKLAITVGSSSTTPGSPPSPPSTGSPGSSPTTPTGTTAPPSPKANGAASVFGMSNVMIGLSSVVATVIALVC